MKSDRYARNEFIFNFCIVLAEEDDFSQYKSVVQKLADLMHALEEQSGFLSRDFSKTGEGKVYSLCEMLMEDLNNYCECMIPIGKGKAIMGGWELSWKGAVLTGSLRRAQYLEHQIVPYLPISSICQSLAGAFIYSPIPGLHG